MADEVRITISIDTEGKASIAYGPSETSSPDLMAPLDPDTLRDLAARTPLEVDEVPEPAAPTELFFSAAPAADIAPRIHDMDALPSESQPATDLVPGPSMLAEFTPATEPSIEYPSMGDQEFRMVPTSTGELPEPPHLGDPMSTVSTNDDVPGPMSPEELSALEN